MCCGRIPVDVAERVADEYGDSGVTRGPRANQPECEGEGRVILAGVKRFSSPLGDGPGSDFGFDVFLIGLPLGVAGADPLGEV